MKHVKLFELNEYRPSQEKMIFVGTQLGYKFFGPDDSEESYFGYNMSPSTTSVFFRYEFSFISKPMVKDIDNLFDFLHSNNIQQEEWLLEGSFAHEKHGDLIEENDKIVSLACEIPYKTFDKLYDILLQDKNAGKFGI